MRFEQAARRTHGTVAELPFLAALAQPARTAVVCEGRALTYAGYADVVLALAARLRGVAGPGRRVAVLLPNGIDACVAHFAVLATGAQLLPVNPAYTARELSLQFADADCAALVVDASLRPLLADVDTGTMTIVGVDEPTHTTPVELPVLDPATLALLQYTGGTSGRPKGVNLTHAAIRTNVEQREAILPTEDGDRVLCAMPLFHSYGMAMGLYLAARCRGTLVILPTYRRETLFDRIEADRITVFPGSPTIYVGLMAHPRFATTDWSSLRVCYSGAAPLPAAVLRQWEAQVRVPIYEGYGQTEAGPVLTYNGPHAPAKPGSVGHPLAATTVEVVDVETGTRVLGANACGEIRARGPQLMSGYRDRPAETAQALRDGWLYTGDLGEFDDDGVLFIRGRKKDLVIVGGFNVYPREVEDVLLEHPGVVEAAVIGVPDDYRGEVLHAYVVLRGSATPADLAAHCELSMAKYKRPARFVVLDSLPKTSVNKIDKLALKSTGERPC